jgi:hypothetical protein
MKFTAGVLTILGGMIAFAGYGQGTLIYDQQSSTDEYIPAYGESGVTMQQIAKPWGQSFTPSLSGIDFIRLKLDDNTPGDGGGAAIYVNLRSDSISGTILGTTATVSMRDGFRGNTNFLFGTTILLTPGVTYYLEPLIVPGSGPWNAVISEYLYPGGSYIVGGSPVFQSDLWFREGVIVPEPAPGLLLLGGAALLAGRRLLQPK